MNTIGERLKYLRKEKGMTQTEAAKYVFNDHQSRMPTIERSEKISTENLIKASRFYGVSCEWLISGSETDCEFELRKELLELREKLAAIQKILE